MSDDNKYRILHIISDLGGGGAEIVLYRLLSLSDRERFDHRVASLTDIVHDSADMRKLGIPVEFMGMRRGVPDPRVIVRLSRLIRRVKPHLIQTWMYHSNLIGMLSARAARTKAPVVWGVHHTEVDPKIDKYTTVLTASACARLSGSKLSPVKIVCCSDATYNTHLKQGYPREKMKVIYNGIDTEVFKADASARRALREELGVGEEIVLIGCVARFAPVKDHRNFIEAAAILSHKYPNVRFLLCGGDIVWENAELAGWIEDAGIRGRCILLGRREDVPRVMAALDIFVSASYSEAFPLAIGEAMSCGLPCVVTDVGDSALIVGDAGIVAHKRNPRELAAGCERLVEAGAERRAMGMAARRRVEENFTLETTVEKYRALYLEVLMESRTR